MSQTKVSPMLKENQDVSIFTHDISDSYAAAIKKATFVAWDIETSGLDWNTCEIATCQLFTSNEMPAIIRIDHRKPKRLASILEDQRIKKIFHHAMFDLRFMAHYWKVAPKNIACTKIASKLMEKDPKKKQTLQLLLSSYLNLEIDKKESLSDWFSKHLTNEQIQYAVTDVFYLPLLLERIEESLKDKALIELEQHCFDHIPTQVQLDISGYKDIYAY